MDRLFLGCRDMPWPASAGPASQGFPAIVPVEGLQNICISWNVISLILPVQHIELWPWKGVSIEEIEFTDHQLYQVSTVQYLGTLLRNAPSHRGLEYLTRYISLAR